MTATKCWDCGTTAHMTPIEGAVSIQQLTVRQRVMGCFRCDSCQAPNIAIATGFLGTDDPLKWLAKKKNKDWVPKPARTVPVTTFPDVPSEIAAAASEAYRCRTVANANRAAILLARSVIEATAKDKGIAKGGLIQKIDKLYDDRLIRPDVRDGAHEVRHLGNDMAHGDFVQGASAEDANLVLTLMSAVLLDVYQSPALVARAQANRQQRETADARAADMVANMRIQYSWMTPEMQKTFAQLAGVPTTAPVLLAAAASDKKQDGEAGSAAEAVSTGP